jgi:hypothetical protein
MGGHMLPTALAQLEDQRNLAVEAALAEALPHMEPVAQAAGVALIASRGHRQGQAALVEHFRQFDVALQHLILDRARDLYPGVRMAMGSVELDERLSTIEFIERSKEGPLYYLLVSGLRARCPSTREAAADSICRLAAHCRGFCADPPSAETRSQLIIQTDCITELLRHALMGWELHHQPKVLEECLKWSDRLEDALLAKLGEPRTRIANAIGSILAGTKDPDLAGCVLRALAMPVLRVAAVEAVCQARGDAFLGALGRHRWLLVDPEIKKGCLRAREMRWLDECERVLGALPYVEAAGLVFVIGATGLSMERKAEAFRKALALRNPELEVSVAWQLLGANHPAATELLGMMAGRVSGLAQRMVKRELQRRLGASFGRAGQSRDTPELQDAPGPSYQTKWEQYWLHFDELSSSQQTAEAEALRSVGTDLLVPLRLKLNSSLAMDRARALRIVARLGFAHDLEEHIYRLTSDPDAIVRSAAVSLLADLPGGTSQRILRRALEDANDRVQANAVGALDCLDAEGRVELLAEKLESPNSRVRANAVKALLRLEIREAGEALIGMLDDASSAHKLSALWVIERLGLHAVVSRVERLSREDADERVRNRARRVLRQLIPGVEDAVALLSRAAEHAEAESPEEVR